LNETKKEDVDASMERERRTGLMGRIELRNPVGRKRARV